MRAIIFLAIVNLAISSFGLGQEIAWTESFDTGIGRFDQTRYQAATKIVWNSSTKRIDGEFQRRSSGQRDVRFTTLDSPLTETDAFGFSAVVVPTGISPDRFSGVQLGFFDSRETNMLTWIGVDVSDNHGRHIRIINESSESVSFAYGGYYFVHFYYQNNLATLNVYEGSNASGNLILSTSLAIASGAIDQFDALGMGNQGSAGSTTMWASIDNISFIFPDCNENGISDNQEIDSDGDGVIDVCDACPLDPLFGELFPRADIDQDCDVDGLDFSAFASCYNGAGNPPRTFGCPPENAAAFDFGSDGDVDGLDFALFAACFNKAGNPPRTQNCPQN